MADRLPRPRFSLRTIRFRATLGAALVVAVALAVAGVVQVGIVRGHLVDAAEDTAASAAIAVAEQARAGVLPERLAVPDDDTRFLQVLDAGGRAVAASENVETTSAVVDLDPPPEDEDDDDRDDADDADDAPDYETTAATFDHLDVDGDGPWRVVALAVPLDAGTMTVVSGSSLEPVDATLATLQRSLLFGIPLLVLVVGAVTLVVVRRSLRPIDRMRTDLGDITSRELHRRVTVPTDDDEVRHLADAMNALLDRLQAASDRQRRFVADASHELRSPLAALRTQLDVVLTHPGTSDWASVARAALRETARMETLTADLLTLAQLDDTAPPATTSVDLAEVAAEVLSGGASPPDRRLRAHLTPDVVIDGHPHQLARALRNLVDNALRHATATVDVTVRRHGTAAIVEVADDGPGIAPELQPAVFERFTRLDDARARDAGGAGLGLAIVREVVLAHGGQVAISRPPGATFTLTFPAAQPA